MYPPATRASSNNVERVDPEVPLVQNITRTERLRSQGFIATRRRVLVMVSSSQGFVEGVR